MLKVIFSIKIDDINADEEIDRFTLTFKIE